MVFKVKTSSHFGYHNRICPNLGFLRSKFRFFLPKLFNFQVIENKTIALVVTNDINSWSNQLNRRHRRNDDFGLPTGQDGAALPRRRVQLLRGSVAVSAVASSALRRQMSTQGHSHRIRFSGIGTRTQGIQPIQLQ